MSKIPSFENLVQAYKNCQKYVHRTPTLVSDFIDQKYSVKTVFKCENFQRTGAYKMRGAINAVLNLSPSQRSKGVSTHSSGNFAQALSLSAKLLNLKAYIVMPETAPMTKRNGVKENGGIIIESGPTLKDRETILKGVLEETHSCFIHPSNNLDVISGHSSATFEILEDCPDLDHIIVPIGGGGLIAGTALAAHYINPQIELIGAEPKNADDAFRSLKAGKIIPISNPHTIADGLRTSLGDLNFPIIRKLVNKIILVEEEEIVKAMHLLWNRLKIIIEPSSAVAFAALLKEQELFKGKKIGIILTGGNVDLDHLPFQSML